VIKKAVAILLTLLILSLTGGNAVIAGDIVGIVKAVGREEAQEDLEQGRYESRKYKFLERLNYDQLQDFIVYIDQTMDVVRPPAKPVQIVIQKNGTFTPHVLPVLVGTTVEWPNKDEIYHNVFSMSEAKSFDLGLYKSDQTKRVTFDKAGRVDVFCSIHTKMNCIILVLNNHYFAVPDKKRFYRISNVPAGTYTLKAWHERLPAQSKQVTVPETGEVQIDFVLSITGLPKY